METNCWHEDHTNERELYEYAQGFAELDASLLNAGHVGKALPGTVVGSRALQAWGTLQGAYSDPTYCRMTSEELIERANAWMRLGSDTGEVIPLLGAEYRSWEEVGPCDPEPGAYGASMTSDARKKRFHPVAMRGTYRKGHEMTDTRPGWAVGATGEIEPCTVSYLVHEDMSYRKQRVGTRENGSAVFATVKLAGHGKWSVPTVRKASQNKRSAALRRAVPVAMDTADEITQAATDLATQCLWSHLDTRQAWTLPTGEIVRMGANHAKGWFDIVVIRGKVTKRTTVRKVAHVAAAITNRLR